MPSCEVSSAADNVLLVSALAATGMYRGNEAQTRKATWRPKRGLSPNTPPATATRSNVAQTHNASSTYLPTIARYHETRPGSKLRELNTGSHTVPLDKTLALQKKRGKESDKLNSYQTLV